MGLYQRYDDESNGSWHAAVADPRLVVLQVGPLSGRGPAVGPRQRLLQNDLAQFHRRHPNQGAGSIHRRHKSGATSAPHD
jgi:hypothetical protein